MVGLLFCTRCKAKVRAESIEDGRYKLDHSIGLYIGKPCGDRSDGTNPLLQFREDSVSTGPTLKKTDNKKKTKSR